MTNNSTEIFTDEEAQILTPFVTNLDKNVFGLINLPEVIKGALFSRYSRSEKSLRRILLKEFIQAPEASFSEIAGEIKATENQLIATQKAEDFYNRVLIGYGDDSVAELGGAHLACEGISNIAAKILEDARLGISPLEKSTRYVVFNQKVNGQYLYCREPAIMNSKYKELYEETLNHLFDTYSNLIEQLLPWVQAQSPKDENTSTRAYHSATKAKTLDILRGLLPMATLTNVGLFGNGRSFEYLLVKLASSSHQEIQELGQKMQSELDQMIPSFVKRAKTERGQEYAHYLQQNRENTAILAEKYLSKIPSQTTETVALVDYDQDGELKVITAILYPQSNLTFNQVQDIVKTLSSSEKIEIINQYVGNRKVRFHRPSRAFEETYYTFDLLADIGAYRDLHRHRVLTQERQIYTVKHGYIIPAEIEKAGLKESYCQALEKAAQTYEIIAQDLPEAAQYVVPFAYKIRWRIKLNLREVYHLVELRSARQGHPSYRFVAQEMYHQIKEIHPNLVAGMSFVDLNDYHLERLAAEQKIDAKLNQL
jgi:thymidylate synthase ThyX